MTFLAKKRKQLHSAAKRGILGSVSRKTLDGKVNGNDSNERAILYPRASGRGAASISRYNYASDQSKKAQGFPGRDPMADWRDCSRAVSRRAEQYPEPEPEIKKATDWWQKTMKNLQQLGYSRRLEPGRNSPRCTLPVFIVTMLGNKSQWLHGTRAWVCDRQEVYS